MRRDLVRKRRSFGVCSLPVIDNAGSSASTSTVLRSSRNTTSSHAQRLEGTQRAHCGQQVAEASGHIPESAAGMSRGFGVQSNTTTSGVNLLVTIGRADTDRIDASNFALAEESCCREWIRGKAQRCREVVAASRGE